jgi:hypothetical protein
LRRAARTDTNQTDIVNGLRKMGAGVTSMAPLGHGVSDLLVSFRQRWYVMEVKFEDGKLNPDQVSWIGAQKAPVYTVRSLDQAVKFLTDTTPDWLLALEVTAMRERTHICEGPKPGDDGPMAPEGRIHKEPLIGRVMEALLTSWRSQTKLSGNDLCERLEVSKTSKRVEKTLRALIREGRVQREGNNRSALYWPR